MLLYLDDNGMFYLFTDGEVPKRNSAREWPRGRFVDCLCGRAARKHIPGAKDMKPGDSATLTVKLTKTKAALRKAKAT